MVAVGVVATIWRGLATGKMAASLAGGHLGCLAAILASWRPSWLRRWVDPPGGLEVVPVGGAFRGPAPTLAPPPSFLPNHVAAVESYPQKAFCGIFSDDGKLFVSACQDQTLRVYTCRGRALRLLRSARGRDVGWSILDVAFSPDASQCLYSSWSDYIHVYDIYGDGDNHTALDLRPEERRFAVFSLAVGPDGREVLGGANDGCVYVYDREVQRRVLRVSPTAGGRGYGVGGPHRSPGGPVDGYGVVVAP
ncbi:DDB1- and CUL4-associated factor 11 isoform X1 [Aix galericulata]|nr:DDB1- and CUL4-associated factor 11 isoform X1 [Aix galericulata]